MEKVAEISDVYSSHNDLHKFRYLLLIYHTCS